MNKYIKISFLSLATLGLVTSCDMDAPTQSTLDESAVYSIYSMAEAGVMAIHQSLCETNAYRGRFMPYYGMNTDVETTSGDVPSYSKRNDDKQNLRNYATLVTNLQMDLSGGKDCYSKFYEAIERANMSIRGLRTYGNIANDPDMAQLLGEALTLRALIYFDLIKMHGDVPLRLEPVTNETMYQPRTNRDVIYKQLLADLDEAADYCYWPNKSSITSTTERVNKAFVKGLRARIALSAGGYGLRGDGYRLSKDPELAPEKMYQIARDECVDVINNYPTDIRQLDFKTVWKNMCQDITTAGGESIYEIPFSDGRGRVTYTWGVKHNRGEDKYQSNSSDKTGSGKGGENGPLPYLFYDYLTDDTRRNVTCVPYDWSAEYYCVQEPRSIEKWCFGKFRYEWMKRYVTSENDDGVNWPIMRLADIYLMAAEAINELEGPANAAQYMRAVLERAIPNPTEVNDLMAKYTAGKDAFFEGIVEQRALEFAGESLRKQDLIRWGNIDEKMAEAQQKLRNLAARTGNYADLPDKLYYKTKTANDGESFDGDNIIGESLLIYGLNHGDTDDEGKRLVEEEGYESKGWTISNGESPIDDDYINGLYIQTPSLNCLWPIWQNVINTSNGMLNNDGVYGQLSE